MQVRPLSRQNAVTVSTCEYLGVPVSRGAGVVQGAVIGTPARPSQLPASLTSKPPPTLNASPLRLDERRQAAAVLGLKSMKEATIARWAELE
jgi:hypothetical protein